MDIFHALLLGIIEGITEFLPISSTGHLILAGKLLGIGESEFTKSFDVVIQLGAILAVVVLYRQRIFSSFSLAGKIIVGFIPTAVIGLVFYRLVKTYLLGNVWVVIGALFVGGVALIVFERLIKKRAPTFEGNSEPTYWQAFWVGVFQAIAIIPGVSRSAATIVGGQLIGVDKKTIVDFSFLLAIPTMLAASGLDLFKNAGSFSMDQFGSLAIGFTVSFLVALIAVKTFLAYIQKHSFAVFGWYRIVLAVLFLLLWW
ncbi:MAG: undecaprenyl-diphosphate phosphatase [Patescibacteria group bacterium]